MSGMWRVCDACGSVVGDIDAHVTWHGDLPPGQANRLRYGHPRDWPQVRGAPPAEPEPPLEPPVSVTEVVTGQPEPTPEP